MRNPLQIQLYRMQDGPVPKQAENTSALWSFRPAFLCREDRIRSPVMQMSSLLMLIFLAGWEEERPSSH